MARTAPVESPLRPPAPPSPAAGEPRTSVEAAVAPRRVLFADEALGLPLAQLRCYRPWGGPGAGKMAEVAGQDGDGGGADEDDDGEDGDEGEEEEEACPEPSPLCPVPAGGGFYVVPTFSLPPAPGRLERLGRVMVELEALLPPPGAVPGGSGVWVPGGRPPVLRGLVRVLNRSFEKAVHVRASHDGWASFCDHPARYVPRSPPVAGTGGPGTGDPILDPGLGLVSGQVYASSPDDGGRTDRFAFQLPFAEGAGDGARLDFVVRYETPEGIFWANNHGRNYTVLLRISPAPSPTDAEGPPQQQQLPQLEPQPESQGTMEAEARQLKSCMKPVRRRPNEEELRMKSSDDNTPAVADHLDVQESVGPLVAPTPLRPWPQMTHQVSEVTVTGRLTEEGDIPRNSASVAFTEVHQTPAIRIPPSSFLCGLGGSPRDQASGPDASEGAAGPLLEPSQPQVEAAWEVSSENGGGRKEPMVGAIMDEPPRGLEAMSGLEELLSEDSIDQELEQLYLSHLSRLRAAVAAGGAGNGGEGSTDGGVSPSHPLGIFTDRDLILKWPGPERALNSALAEEITLHYARLGRGVELIKDTEDPDEEGEGEEGLSTIPSSPEGGTPKESPPEILSGARSVVATMGDVWLPWAGGLACDSPVVLGPEGQFNGAPEKGMRKDTDSLHTNRVISGVPGFPGGTEARMESTEWADSLVPVSGKEPAVSGPQEQNLTLLGVSGAEIGPSSLARCHVSFQDEEGSGLSLESPKRSPTLAAPAECVCVLSPQLWGPLTQTLGVLAGLVVVPVALNSGMSLLVLALCLSLAWFS
ncbi:protein phosphatase 1 regulatory subunit 3F isoform X1 [Myotis myotis]|uniref:Protein phosphatase 1 regulatory subunit 3F n=1 Tax=Myotis myotis TaxID=51298 RepID=A0A7J7YFA0_MYOMY|nr:protein phosphatase 1 regulatory subunit 3F isoform X1 [Myotis myotis]KAF6360524.1 protein phosphatase 1 regulatory subunit 3F [Myotis myotis]